VQTRHAIPIVKHTINESRCPMPVYSSTNADCTHPQMIAPPQHAIIKAAKVNDSLEKK